MNKFIPIFLVIVLLIGGMILFFREDPTKDDPSGLITSNEPVVSLTDMSESSPPIGSLPNPVDESNSSERETSSTGTFSVVPDSSSSTSTDTVIQLPDAARRARVGIRETAKTGAHPERIALQFPAEPWDEKRWATSADYRAAYLSESIPSRVFDSKPFAKETIRIKADKNQNHVPVKALASVGLVVHAAPSMPVSFTVLDLGTLDNGLTAQTIVADDKGLATITYTAIAGVVNSGTVLVGSPACSGQVEFTVHVTDKE